MSRKSKTQGGVSTSELRSLQALIVKALELDLTTGIETGEVNQAAIRNALQLLRDNDVVATEELVDEMNNIASLIPRDLVPVVSFTKYE